MGGALKMGPKAGKRCSHQRAGHDKGGKVAQFKTKYGFIQTPDWQDDLIVTSLAKHGEWAFVEHHLFATLIRKGDRVWDGGAFLGTFGIGAAQIAAEHGQKPAFLLAIEPGAEINICLQANLQWNSPCPWDLASCAISLNEGILQAVTEAEANHGSRAYHQITDTTHDDATHDSEVSGFAKLDGDAPVAKGPASNTMDQAPHSDAEGSGAPVQVEGFPLWRLRALHGDYECMKLDIEGMEFEALKSDFDYIRDKKPVIWAECNESPASLKVLEAMLALGYYPVYVAFPAFRSDNFNRNPDQIYPMAYEAALVAAPPDRLADFDPVAAAPGYEIIVHHVQNEWDLRKALWATPRWAMADWAKMKRSELIAIMGRQARGETLDRFLTGTD